MIFGRTFGLMMECTKRVQRREQDLKLQVIAQLGAKDKELLASILHEEDDPLVLEYAAKAAGKIKDSSFVEPLLAIVRNADMRIPTKTAAIKALGRIGDARAIPTLQQKAASYSASIRNAAIWALAHINHEDAIQTVVSCVQNANKRTRKSVLSALAKRNKQ